ncbi:MAG: DNA-binding protein Alba [Candidatus Methanospirareceae archaeon]
MPGEDNVIYIGNKSVMSYVLAVVTQFNNGFDEVVIKARGRAISRAVDTAEVVRNKFMPGLEVKEIKIGTEEITGEGGDKANVSSIEITMATKAEHK